MARIFAGALLLSLLLNVPPVEAAPARIVTLALPRAARSGEAIWLQVEAGVLARGAEIAISTPDGKQLGVVSPFAIRGGHEAGTYSIPLTGGAIRRGRVTVWLSLIRAGASPRAPTRHEVKSVRIAYVKTGG